MSARDSDIAPHVGARPLFACCYDTPSDEVCSLSCLFFSYRACNGNEIGIQAWRRADAIGTIRPCHQGDYSVTSGLVLDQVIDAVF
jgi:hypothetical protein